MAKIPNKIKKSNLSGNHFQFPADYLNPHNKKVVRAFNVVGKNLPKEFTDKYKDKLVIKNNRVKLSGDGIFYTLQGEGSYTGEPAIFVRVHVCNLHCTFCWAAGTKILTPNGEVKIEDLKVGDKVITYKDKRYSTDEIQRLYRGKSKLVKFTTEEGISTITAHNHTYLTNHHAGNKTEQKAEDLLNKFVLKGVGTSSFKYPLAFKNLDERIGYAKGAMLGDGNITRYGKYYSIFWQVCDKDFAEALLNIINNDFGHHGRITTYKRDEKHQLVYRISVGTEKTALVLSEKPTNPDQWRGFIAGFFDAEGHTGRNQLILTQKDETLLKNVQRKLLNLGFISHYEILHATRADSIVINGKEQLEHFFKLFPVQIKRKIDTFINVPRTNKSVKVTSVDYLGESEADVFGFQTVQGKVFANGYLALSNTYFDFGNLHESRLTS